MRFNLYPIDVAFAWALIDVASGDACDTNETCAFGDCVGGGCCSVLTASVAPRCTSCLNSTAGGCTACSARYTVEDGQCIAGDTAAPSTPVPSPESVAPVPSPGGVAESSPATPTGGVTTPSHGTVPAG